MSERVVIVGASPKPERYANKALHELLTHGHTVFLVHPTLHGIEGMPVYSSLEQVPGPIDTVTMYVSKANSDAMWDDFLEMKPKRVIFNPGAENPELAHLLTGAGVKPIEACTLVLLKTGQF